MSQEILGFLRNIVSADQQTNTSETIAVEKIGTISKKANKNATRKKVQGSWQSFKNTVGRLISKR
jgi:hypothetical protein